MRPSLTVVDGERIYGPGIADDKGGIAVVLHALKILKEAGWKDFAKLTVLFNPDEEVGSIGSGELIAELADQHDFVLSCEPTVAAPAAKNDGLLLGASGTATGKMEVKGRASHAGAAPQLGRNALIELAHQLLQTRDVAKSIPGTQLNWTTAQAGKVRNQIPENAVAGADIRVTVKDGLQMLQAALNEKVKDKLIADTETTITIEAGRPPFVATDRGRLLAMEGKEIYAELGPHPRHRRDDRRRHRRRLCQPQRQGRGGGKLWAGRLWLSRPRRIYRRRLDRAAALSDDADADRAGEA